MSQNSEGSPPRIAWVVVGALWLAFIINYLDRQVVFSIFPALKRDLGFTDTQLGLVGSLFVSIYAICMPVMGRVADLFRRDRLVLAALGLWSVATLGTALSQSVGQFLVWRIVMGVMEALYFPAAMGLIAALHPGPTRSRAIAFHASAQFVGIAIGGWYGGWAADHIGWRQGFFVLTVVGALYGAFLWRVLRVLPALRYPEKKAASVSPLAVFRAPTFLALSAAFFSYCMMLWMLYAWLPTFLYERYHLSMTESGFTATIYLQTSSAIGVLTGGVMGDRFGKRLPGGRFYVAACGLLLCSPFAYLALVSPSLLLLKAGVTIFGLTAGLFMGNHFAACYDVTSERNYGFSAAALNMIGGFSGSAAIFLAGLWKNSLGIRGLMGWGAMSTALTAAIMIVVVARRFHEDRRRAGLE